MSWTTSAEDSGGNTYRYYERDLKADCEVACAQTVIGMTRGIELTGGATRAAFWKIMGGAHDFDKKGPTTDQTLEFLHDKGSAAWRQRDWSMTLLNHLSPDRPMILQMEGLYVRSSGQSYDYKVGGVLLERSNIGHSVVGVRVSGGKLVCLDPAQGVGLVETPTSKLPGFTSSATRWAQIWHVITLPPPVPARRR